MQNELIQSLKEHRISLSENLLGRRVTIGLGTLGGSGRRRGATTHSQPTTTTKKEETAKFHPQGFTGRTEEENQKIRDAIARGEITPADVGEYLFQMHKSDKETETK